MKTNTNYFDPNQQFRSVDFLTTHLQSILDLYYPQCIDEKIGGYSQHFRPDGKVADNTQRHLVSSSRLTINFALSALHFKSPEYLAAARHGIDYLRTAHRNSETGAYAWILEDEKVVDDCNHCYGLAFVLMAYARSYAAGVEGAFEYIEELFEFMETHFWRPDDQLYVDEIGASLKVVSPYRGQNANMHCCEALISVYEATKDSRYLDRAQVIARRITVDLAAQCDGLIWEHYDRHWQVDFDYNRGDTENKLRPWGYQPGHFVEWAKLLLIVNKHTPQEWLATRAKELFDLALAYGFDIDHGGLYYGFSPAGDICSNGKYSWVQAEAVAAAALLAAHTGDRLYWCIYQQMWQYSWNNMVDHERNGWHRNLTFDNKIIDTSSISMGRTDYHSVGACVEILHCL